VCVCARVPFVYKPSVNTNTTTTQGAGGTDRSGAPGSSLILIFCVLFLSGVVYIYKSGQEGVFT